MSKTNPRKAVAALLPAPIPIPGTAEAVQPFSLATYGILEKIGSPLVVPAQGPVTALDLIPSLYVVTHDAVDVLAGDIAADSVAWAKTLPPTALILMEQAARRQIGVFIDVLPESDVKKNAKGTAGLPSSPDGPAKPTAGHGARWLSRFLSRRWRSCTGSGCGNGAKSSSGSQR